MVNNKIFRPGYSFIFIQKDVELLFIEKRMFKDSEEYVMICEINYEWIFS